MSDMAMGTRVKHYVNSILARANVQVDSLTAERAESSRLHCLDAAGHFDKPVFPTPASFGAFDPTALLIETAKHEPTFAKFDSPRADGGYTFENEYFTSPDAEILYSIIHLFRPATIVEVGCGNSTKLCREAITDAGLFTQLLSIDPSPRIEITSVPDKLIRSTVESLDPAAIADRLSANDILFIDSSHTVKPGGDVCFIFLQVLPRLKDGVIVHIHDIFCPYDYPREWIVDFRWPWNEQYLVQAFLEYEQRFEVLWAGYYLQRKLENFSQLFPRVTGRRASSLWLRIRS